LKTPNTIKRKIRAGGMAQVIERLPKKCETLSSNPSIRKKQSKQNQGSHSNMPEINNGREVEIITLEHSLSLESSSGVQHLLSMDEALASIPSTEKRRKTRLLGIDSHTFWFPSFSKCI
jgi:hypothetical protein